MGEFDAYSALGMDVDREAAERRELEIGTLPVSASWRATFLLIEKAGGVEPPKLFRLTSGEMRRVRVNFLVLLFGPFYYFAKGMWIKGIVLAFICAGVVGAGKLMLNRLGMNQMTIGVGCAAGLIFASRANLDFYKKMVLKQNG